MEKTREIAEQNPKTEQEKLVDTILTNAMLNSPDDYLFEFAEDTQVDTALIEEFKRFAFEQKMSLENAKLMAKFYENHVQNQCRIKAREAEELLRTMYHACENDKEYGGKAFYDNMRYAKAAMLRFDDGSLAKILNETGFGSHPEVVRFMYRVGKALAEKDMPCAANRVKKAVSTAELFYPSMCKQ